MASEKAVSQFLGHEKTRVTQELDRIREQYGMTAEDPITEAQVAAAVGFRCDAYIQRDIFGQREEEDDAEEEDEEAEDEEEAVGSDPAGAAAALAGAKRRAPDADADAEAPPAKRVKKEGTSLKTESAGRVAAPARRQEATAGGSSAQNPKKRDPVPASGAGADVIDSGSDEEDDDDDDEEEEDDDDDEEDDDDDDDDEEDDDDDDDDEEDDDEEDDESGEEEDNPDLSPIECMCEWLAEADDGSLARKLRDPGQLGVVVGLNSCLTLMQPTQTVPIRSKEPEKQGELDAMFRALHQEEAVAAADKSIELPVAVVALHKASSELRNGRFAGTDLRFLLTPSVLNPIDLRAILLVKAGDSA